VVTSDSFVAWKQQGCFPKNTALGTREMGFSHFNFEGTRLGVHSGVCDLTPKADC